MWDIKPDFALQHEVWKNDGPELKLEFSRISCSRLRALTLVIDEQNGTACNVRYAMSKRKSPDDAICDLRRREGTVLKRIGYHFSDGSQSGEPNTPGAIREWATINKLDVVVWTGLESNFGNEHGSPFSIPEALTHLKSLSPEGKVKAAEYVWRAPDFVQTKLRAVLQSEPWFNAQ